MTDRVRQAFEARIKTLGDESRQAFERSKSVDFYTDREREKMRQRAKALGVAAQEIRKVLDTLE